MRTKYAIDAHQYADFATLRGDASDGLPGVAGVGEKTAATLLTRFGDMAGLLIIEMFVFILILAVGYVYIWKRGALQWD